MHKISKESAKEIAAKELAAARFCATVSQPNRRTIGG